MTLSNILKAVFVRVALLVLNFAAVWRVTVVWGNDKFWLLLVANVPFLLEGLFVVIKKQGIEWKWLCPCFLFFLMSTMPAIWLLEISRQGTYAAMNTTAIDGVDIAGVRIPIRLNADTWVLLIEECLLYFMILGRWFLPRGEVSREQLSMLLFSFIAIASDIMELFALFDEDVVRGSLVITYVLLAIWTWSILQFTLVLTVYNRPKKGRVTQKTESKMMEQKDAVRMEIVAIFISMFMQDGPFLVLRLYCLLEFQLITYSVVFFTFKNFLVIILLVYRVSILCANNYCFRKDGEKDEGELVDDYEQAQIRMGKHPDHTIVVNHGYYEDDGMRKRSRPSGLDNSSSSGVMMNASLKGESDVDRARISHQNSAIGSDSTGSYTMEMGLMPDPMAGNKNDDAASVAESCRL